MVTFKRLMLWVLLGAGLLIYLTIQGRIDDQVRWIYLGLIALLAIGLMGTGGGRKVRRVRRRPQASDVEESEEESLPAPVIAEDDTTSRRDQKLARSRKGETVPEAEPDDEEVVVALADDEVAVQVIDENVHVAEEYIAEVDAESMEEAEIESFIDDRRGHHDLIRRRIEARRREQLAEIRSETAKMYQSADESEDIMALLATDGHGQTIIDESLEIPTGSPVGAVFSRIDDHRILKVRIPLDQGFIASKEPLPELPPLPDLDGMPPPPLPDLGDMPPPPLPSLSKLDAMRDELED